MDSKRAPARPDAVMGQVRDILKLELIKDDASNTDGAIVEIVSYPNGEPGGYYWVSGAAFNSGDAPIAFDPGDMDNGQPWLNDIHLALWLFGPSSVREPGRVYRWLHAHMAKNSRLYVANEMPWRGKMPQMNEYGHYTDEEIHASLVRAGFENIRCNEDGPYFRLWMSSRSESIHSEMFHRVESQLGQGDWRGAVESLGRLDDFLDTLPAVREYALLLAACHDLAGNITQSYVALTEALRIDPSCGRAMCGLGRLAAISQDLDGALLFFESALKKSPALVAALEGHALVSELRGDLRSAYEDLIDASNFRPKDEELLLEVIRVGNLIGYQDELASFVSARNAAEESWDPPAPVAIDVSQESATFRISC
ncbi:MAG: hypothetical protein JXX14_06680 [Deltaproteobacteria bacterium]|nr:hypothetical protein [Deltaproteobacteria bacterium]